MLNIINRERISAKNPIPKIPPSFISGSPVSIFHTKYHENKKPKAPECPPVVRSAFGYKITLEIKSETA